MKFNEVKEYLEERLPDFTFTSAQEAGQPEELHTAIRITRDNKYLDIDVRKIDNKSQANTLVDYIKGKWKISE